MKKKKKGLNDTDNPDGVITHLEPGVGSQIGLMKHYYVQR